jgi:FKBP-type peptidyl-prolyl cis-trans isomerase FkpA
VNVAALTSTHARKDDRQMRASHLALVLLSLSVVACGGSAPAPESTGAPVAASAPAPVRAETPVADVSALVKDDRTPGTGAEARPGMTVSVHYTGWLYDPTAADKRGKKFDSSKDRNEPFEFPLGAGQVIAGWDQGVAGMKVGGTRIPTIPSNMGYGARGAGGVIPPNATLVFEVELLGV